MRNELAHRPGLLAMPSTRRELRAAYTEGQVASARIKGMALAAQTALLAAGSLSAMETTLIQAVPVGDARYKTIVDAFTVAAANELYSMGMR